MSAESTPPTARRELGTMLRSLRTQHELGLEEVGAAIAVTPGFLSRVERGLRGLGDDKAERLADFYALPARSHRKLRQLARLARQKPWWEHAPVTREMREYIGFEQAASAITTYGSIVPGLFQTRAYCEAVVDRTAIDTPDEDRATTVEHRIRRQELLDGADPPWIWAILDESVLHRATGGPDTMREQLTALAAAADRPRVSIRVLPYSAGAHPGMDSRFVIVSTKGDHGPELVYVEGLSGARNLFKDEDLARYAAAWQSLSALALSEEDSGVLIREAIPHS
ncbi:helix-turn-helix domain-containing protein [Pseudonocardia kunmingensis]|uniref:Helix-turn-helix protein n=1 Tax=Pseudonocardia kunmingensis TaxID=630975 RepID=A0A543DZ80_9PSEU|nr:helix-turn-helix transcriptional regulator [Pseudonocardia kunmingensis]TQM14645.1 helix-turn-helix protein [Pseudonocardia kunmingensis]